MSIASNSVLRSPIAWILCKRFLSTYGLMTTACQLENPQAETPLTIIHARFQRLINLSLTGVTRKSNDHVPHQGPCLFCGPNLPDSRQTVHDWHFQIHQDGIVPFFPVGSTALGLPVRFTNQVERFQTIVRDCCEL